MEITKREQAALETLNQVIWLLRKEQIYVVVKKSLVSQHPDILGYSELLYHADTLEDCKEYLNEKSDNKDIEILNPLKDEDTKEKLFPDGSPEWLVVLSEDISLTQTQIDIEVETIQEGFHGIVE